MIFLNNTMQFLEICLPQKIVLIEKSMRSEASELFFYSSFFNSSSTCVILSSATDDKFARYFKRHRHLQNVIYENNMSELF